MIRPIQEKDRALYLALADEFYHSDAVLHPVPPAYLEAAFAEMTRSDVYLQGYILEHEGETAGYAVLAKMFSCEAGGLCVWIEEIYIRAAFRGKGLGGEFLRFCKAIPDVKRLRLEIEESNTAADALYRRNGFQPLDYAQRVLEQM